MDQQEARERAEKATGPYAYTVRKVYNDIELRRAMTLIKLIAKRPENLVCDDIGQDLNDGMPGIVPIDGADPGGDWAGVEHLIPFLQVSFQDPNNGNKSPLRFTFEYRRVRAATGLVVLRVLTIQTDVITPSHQPLMPSAVEEQQDLFFALVQPWVKLWLPMHESVGASILAHNPVPRVSTAGLHSRTAVHMRFSAQDDDPYNTINQVSRRGSDGRPSVMLFGPDDKPIRS